MIRQIYTIAEISVMKEAHSVQIDTNVGNNVIYQQGRILDPRIEDP